MTKCRGAIRIIHAGECYLPSALAARLAERGPGSTLSAREREVLELVSKGLSNREIGAALDCSEATAKWTPSPGRPLDLRKSEVRFTIRRLDYHAPRRYAAFTSMGGFTNGAQVFDTGNFTNDTDREFVFSLPNTAAYSNLTSAVTFRFCGYSGQYGGHRTSLRAFKLSADPATVQTAFNQWKFDHGLPATAAADSDSDHDGVPLLLEYALHLDPMTASVTGLPAGAISNNSLTLTYTKVKAATDITYAAEVASAVMALWSASPTDVDQSWLVTDHG